MVRRPEDMVLRLEEVMAARHLEEAMAVLRREAMALHMEATEVLRLEEAMVVLRWEWRLSSRRRKKVRARL